MKKAFYTNGIHRLLLKIGLFIALAPTWNIADSWPDRSCCWGAIAGDDAMIKVILSDLYLMINNQGTGSLLDGLVQNWTAQRYICGVKIQIYRIQAKQQKHGNYASIFRLTPLY